MTSTQSPRLAAALAAARNGWPVFQLYPLSKKWPMVKDWENRATLDEGTIRAWWAQTPYANIGIACGPARLVVVDLDDSHGNAAPPEWADLDVRHGRDVLRILAERAGEEDPVDTRTVATPRGGEHRYFLAPPDVELRNTQGDTPRGLGWRIDTRAHGGFIVAEGSAVKQGGALRLYSTMRARPVAPLPRWLVARLTPPPRPARNPIPVRVRSSTRDRLAQGTLERAIAKVRDAREGNRAYAVFWAAVTLGELVGGGFLDEVTAERELFDAAAVHYGVAEFCEREAAGHIRRGLERGRQQPPWFIARPPRPEETH